MSLDAQLFAALSPLVNGEVYPDVAPDGVARPYITYQQVGGDVVNYTEGSIPDRRNARVQINVWAETRLGASSLSELVEDTLRPITELQTSVIGARASVYEPETKLRGARQDFSIWY
ncbi:DUF3168 domain-containing protein [Oxalobacteraceae bacterium OTU3CINTB1]|nr:DUF3168 domain-containing protein [Oxalobacteraceae bacterium OTU3CINTB1]